MLCKMQDHVSEFRLVNTEFGLVDASAKQQASHTFPPSTSLLMEHGVGHPK